jgi:Dimerisation domain
MSSEYQPNPQSLPHHLRLIQMGGFAVPRVLYVAAELGLADELQSGPKSAAELAGPMKLHSPSLHRLMRTLARLGIPAEREAQRFELTPLGEALKSGTSNSARSTLRTFGSLHFQRAWDHFTYSLQTGKTGMEKERSGEFPCSTTSLNIQRMDPFSARLWLAFTATNRNVSTILRQSCLVFRLEW